MVNLDLTATLCVHNGQKIMCCITEPRREKMGLFMTYANSKASGEIVHSRNFARSFAVCFLYKHLMLIKLQVNKASAERERMRSLPEIQGLHIS